MPAAHAQVVRSKTEVFRERMAQIKKKESDPVDPPSSASGSSEPASEPTRKKGCFGLFVLALAIGLGGLAGSINWLL